jgi:hypothetical protein
MNIKIVKNTSDTHANFYKPQATFLLLHKLGLHEMLKIIYISDMCNDSKLMLDVAECSDCCIVEHTHLSCVYFLAFL